MCVNELLYTQLARKRFLVIWCGLYVTLSGSVLPLALYNGLQWLYQGPDNDTSRSL